MNNDTILGIDPGTTRIGYGIIKEGKNKFLRITSGVLEIEKNQKNLLDLEKGLDKIIKKFKPTLIGIEKIFFSKNKKTAMDVAQARGVIISCCLKYTEKTFEITPAEAKIATTSRGNASKNEVSRMVEILISSKNKTLLDDETDALAIAIATSAKAKDYNS